MAAKNASPHIYVTRLIYNIVSVCITVLFIFCRTHSTKVFLPVSMVIFQMIAINGTKRQKMLLLFIPKLCLTMDLNFYNVALKRITMI